eukprot:scaffold2162_cov398-Prasinococcus_capsulatus_cf.AAC.11
MGSKRPLWDSPSAPVRKSLRLRAPRRLSSSAQTTHSSEGERARLVILTWTRVSQYCRVSRIRTASGCAMPFSTLHYGGLGGYSSVAIQAYRVVWDAEAHHPSIEFV